MLELGYKYSVVLEDSLLDSSTVDCARARSSGLASPVDCARARSSGLEDSALNSSHIIIPDIYHYI